MPPAAAFMDNQPTGEEEQEVVQASAMCCQVLTFGCKTVQYHKLSGCGYKAPNLPPLFGAPRRKKRTRKGHVACSLPPAARSGCPVEEGRKEGGEELKVEVSAKRESGWMAGERE